MTDRDRPETPDRRLKPRRPLYQDVKFNSLLEQSRSRDTGGIGLGLAIAQSIVQSHGGELMLSDRPAGGLRANIELPR